jgi:hypothetical protein
MLKTILTIAGVLVLGQAVRLPAADAQSGYRSPNDPGSPKGVADYRPTLGSFFPIGVLPAPGGEGTAQPRSSNPSGFVCCVSPEGRSTASPE